MFRMFSEWFGINSDDQLHSFFAEKKKKSDAGFPAIWKGGYNGASTSSQANPTAFTAAPFFIHEKHYPGLPRMPGMQSAEAVHTNLRSSLTCKPGKGEVNNNN